MGRLLQLFAVLFALSAVALGAGFAGFVTAAHRAPVPPPQADGIVVLTGGAERVETGLRLLAANRARLLLVSGVAGGAGLGELLHRAGLAEDATDVGITSRITLGRTARTTAGNADETAEWAGPHQIRSLIVVTAGFHMPRAMLELHRAMPAVTLHPVQVQPQAMGRLSSARVLAVEYLKLLGAWAGLSQLTHQPISIVLRTPGDNSVNG